MIHKTKKEEGKKHIWGQNFGCSDEFQGRFRPFSACFGRIGLISRRPTRLDMVDTARFWPNQPNLLQIEPHRRELSRVGAHSKKKHRRGTDAWSTTSDAMSRVGLGCGTLPVASVLSSRLLYISNSYLMILLKWTTAPFIQDKPWILGTTILIKLKH